jgi:hypothetical protein
VQGRQEREKEKEVSVVAHQGCCCCGTRKGRCTRRRYMEVQLSWWVVSLVSLGYHRAVSPDVPRHYSSLGHAEEFPGALTPGSRGSQQELRVPYFQPHSSRVWLGWDEGHWVRASTSSCQEGVE